MILRVDQRLVEEAESCSFRFQCDACVHFDPPEERCVHGYPTEPHRGGRSLGSLVVFCKEFELGA